MNKTLATFFFSAATLISPLFAQQGKNGFLPLPADIIALDSDSGRAMLNTSESAPFWRLIQFFSIQETLTTCSVASCTTVLNALKIERPPSEGHGEFKLYTADNFFTPAVESIVTKEKVGKSGMSLDEIGKVLATFPVQSQRMRANDITLEQFREHLKKGTAGDAIMLANYLRKSLGQESGGHLSPIGAFSAKEDRVLILDVSTYKYPWVWVKTEQLFDAMGGNDQSKLSRGFVMIAAPAN